MTSPEQRFARLDLDDLHQTRRYSPLGAYCHLEGFTQHPAIGALPIVRAAVDPDVVGGEYFGPAGFLQIYGYPVRVDASRRARDHELAARLWAASEALTGADYGVLR